MSESVSLLDPGQDFVRREIARVGAPADELAAAHAFVASDEGRDPRAYDALTPRLRRLVDLVTVVGAGTIPPAIDRAEPILLDAAG